MTDFLLDSNVLSEVWKPRPDPTVLEWYYTADWFLPVPVIAEVQEGVEASPTPARRTMINARLDAFLQAHGLVVVDWDTEASRTWGRLKHSSEVKLKPQALWDSLIDAMAFRHGMTIATRNTTD